MLKILLILLIFSCALFNFPKATFGISEGIPIYTYHYVGFNPNPGKDNMRDNLTTSPEKQENDLKQISETKNTIFLEELNENIKNPVVLTFDDGYVDFYINAYPLLRKYNLKAVQFVPTGLVGKSGYLTWDMIEEMQNSGLVSFQSHTVTHTNLNFLSYSKILAELTESKKTLEEKTGHTVQYLSYPYGTNNATVQLAAKTAGYKAALSTWKGVTIGYSYNMPRLSNLLINEKLSN